MIKVCLAHLMVLNYQEIALKWTCESHFVVAWTMVCKWGFTNELSAVLGIKTPLGTEICMDICLLTLHVSVPRSEQFSERGP